MKDIKRRIKSIENTGQITKAMELVASAKLRKAKQRATDAQPFFDTLYETVCQIAAVSKHLSSRYINKREVKNSLLVVIAGDRGLAGGYNNNIIKMAVSKINNDKKNGIDTKVIAIGKKAVEYFQKRDLLSVGFIDIGDTIDAVKSRHISRLVLDKYNSGEADQVTLYYTEFISAMSQIATESAVLPLVLLPSKEVNTSSEVVYEPSPESVLDHIVPLFVEGMVYCGISESFASEQGARRTAMESANDNAKEMVDTLSLKYNRARQSAITQEISEIVSGANSA